MLETGIQLVNRNTQNNPALEHTIMYGTTELGPCVICLIVL